MKKRLVVSIVIIILLFLGIYMFGLFSSIKSSDDSIDFLNENYITFDGGKPASEFYTRYVYLKDYENIDFKYRNYEHRLIMLSKTYTSFCVDVQYSENQFKEIFKKTLAETDFPDVQDVTNYHGNYLITTIMIEEPIYKENYCGVFFNEENNTVRYVFLYDVKREEVIKRDPRRLVSLSVDLDWE